MCRNCTHCPLPVKKNMLGNNKLKGNQNVRDTKSGRFAPETERNNPERVVETDREKVTLSVEAVQVEGCAFGLDTAASEEEVHVWFGNLILAACELRGAKLRAFTDTHVAQGTGTWRQFAKEFEAEAQREGIDLCDSELS